MKGLDSDYKGFVSQTGALVRPPHTPSRAQGFGGGAPVPHTAAILPRDGRQAFMTRSNPYSFN